MPIQKISAAVWSLSNFRNFGAIVKKSMSQLPTRGIKVQTLQVQFDDVNSKPSVISEMSKSYFKVLHHF